MRSIGGLKAYLNTNNLIKVEEMIDSGNEKAKLIFEAMAYQIAKGIGELSTVLKGDLDKIVLTGGMAYSDRLVALIKERVEFIGEIMVMPGENEMESLTLGALRVLRGEEEAEVFDL